MGTVRNRARDRIIQTSTLTLFSVGVIFVLLVSIPESNSLWSRQLRIDAQVNAGTWTTPTETVTATPTLTDTPTPTPTPTETLAGQAGTSIEVQLTIRGFKAGETDPTFGVEGQVCVTNKGEVPTENLSIHDMVEIKTSAGPFEKYIEFDVDVGGRPILEPGQAYCYPYFKSFTPAEDPETKYRNSAEVTITNHSGWMPGGKNCPGSELCPFGPTEKGDFDFSGLLVSEQSMLTSTVTLTPTSTLTGTLTVTFTETCTETLVDAPTPTGTPSVTDTPEASPTNTLTDEVLPPMDTPTVTPEPPPTDTPEPPPTDTPVPKPPSEESPSP